ncbi:hypothetical protein M427DRAFT_29331 [Gonapodya prolifera JEL478]|uniref:Uncharacterized protein n=1 Tax=Gonapodya prolifera (strain JEL478) TaxID=1344416 RepID=A0A139AQU4_GONPJ|nr:hypothetical protein M427DRAFT_29331 [Gonapodya prolifera JEL478]|eukprot:KXS18865.1 hypothetical protein M427DRAFT_29331 [Gonapodya prolifera JEL478]
MHDVQHLQRSSPRQQSPATSNHVDLWLQSPDESLAIHNAEAAVPLSPPGTHAERATMQLSNTTQYGISLQGRANEHYPATSSKSSQESLSSAGSQERLAGKSPTLLSSSGRRFYEVVTKAETGCESADAECDDVISPLFTNARQADGVHSGGSLQVGSSDGSDRRFQQRRPSNTSLLSFADSGMTTLLDDRVIGVDNDLEQSLQDELVHSKAEADFKSLEFEGHEALRDRSVEQLAAASFK